MKLPGAGQNYRGGVKTDGGGVYWGVGSSLTNDKGLTTVWAMGKVTSITRGKTEQRIKHVVSILKSASQPLSYDEIRIQTGAVKIDVLPKRDGGTWRGGMAYDTLLYVTSTLIEVGLVERIDVPTGHGRPRAFFVWKTNRKANAARTRLSA